MSNNSLPIHGINQSQRNMRDSISRLVTGIKVLGGNDVADQTMANTLNAEGASFNRVVKNTQKGMLSFSSKISKESTSGLLHITIESD